MCDTKVDIRTDRYTKVNARARKKNFLNASSKKSSNSLVRTGLSKEKNIMMYFGNIKTRFDQPQDKKQNGLHLKQLKINYNGKHSFGNVTKFMEILC